MRSFILLLVPTAPRYTTYLRTLQDKCIPRECRLTTPDVPVKSNIATMLAARKCFYRGKFVSLSSKKRQRNLHANPLLARRYQVRSLSKRSGKTKTRYKLLINWSFFSKLRIFITPYIFIIHTYVCVYIYIYTVTCVIYMEPHNETSFYITRHNSLLTSHVTPGSYIVEQSEPASLAIHSSPPSQRTHGK